MQILQDIDTEWFHTWFNNAFSIIIGTKSLGSYSHLLLSVRSIVLPDLDCIWGSKPSAVAKAKWCLNSGDAARCILKMMVPFSALGKKTTHAHTMRLPPSHSQLLSLKLHRFQQQYTSSAGFDCTGLLAPSLHQWSSSLSKARRKTRTKATFPKMTALYPTRQPAMDLTQHRATVSVTVTQIYEPPIGLFVCRQNVQDS